MTTWPATLPQAPLIEGFTETAPITALRTEMDQGPAKTRQKTTAGVARMTLSFILSRSQTQTLDVFFKEGTKGGTISFVFLHPRTSASLSCRFVQPPRYQSLNGESFKAAIELEVLP